jgi:putative transposase
MIRNFKYRLLGNKEVFSKADNWLFLMRQLYNAALEEKIVNWNQAKHNISCYEQMKELKYIRRELPEYAAINAQTLRTPLHRLDFAFQKFFKGIKRGERVGFPRFKGKGRFNSFAMEQNGWKLDGKYLTIRNLGKFKIRLSRPLEGDIKRITIHKEPTGKWYALFSCENILDRKLKPSNKIIGIDVGIKSFLVDSDGKKVHSPNFLRKGLGILRTRRRKLSRCKRGSNNRNKTKLLVAKTYEHITSQRHDWLHKLTNYYIKNYGIICIEDLNIQGLAQNHSVAISVTDAGWRKFFDFLNYKAEEAGRVVIKVPRFEPTSKTCSQCGAINQELKLNERQWVCKSCGVSHDRDYNAAKNIKRVGQTQQMLTCGNSQSVVCESQQWECQESILKFNLQKNKEVSFEGKPKGFRTKIRRFR